PVAGLLVPPERSRKLGPRAVDVHIAGAQARRDLHGVLHVSRLHVARETVRCVVGHRYGLFLALIGKDAEDGAKDLLAGDRHVVADVAENRRLHEVALLEALRPTGAAADQFGALLDAL